MCLEAAAGRATARDTLHGTEVAAGLRLAILVNIGQYWSIPGRFLAVLPMSPVWLWPQGTAGIVPPKRHQLC